MIDRPLRPKLTRPAPPPDLVARPKLVDSLGRGLDRRVTVLSAPAGAGKSTAVVEWLESEGAPPSAWLTLDRLDGDLGHFLLHFAEAASSLVPDGVEELSLLLGSSVLPSIERVAEILIADLLPAEGVLVLDELDCIEAGDAIQLIDALVAAGLPGLHLVLMGRADPPLSLSLWRARGWSNEFRGADLAFSQEQVRQLMNASGLDGLSEEAVELLHRKTEGWPAGLRLAQLFLSRASDPEAGIRALSGTHRLIVDFMIQEVLDALDEESRTALAVLGQLQRFSSPLCDHLLEVFGDTEYSVGVLDRLRHSNLFVIPGDSGGEWYRFHGLFRQVLQDRVRTVAPHVDPERVRVEAARWFEGHGRVQEALHLLLEAGSVEEAADVLAGHMDEIVDRDPSREELARWLDMFPLSSLDRRPSLLVASLYSLVPRGEYPEIRRRLDRAGVSGADGDGASEGRLWENLTVEVSALRAFERYWGGDMLGALHSSTKGLDQDPARGTYVASKLRLYHARALAAVGEPGAFEQFLAEWTVEARSRDPEHLAPALLAEAEVALLNGDLQRCRRAAGEIVAWADESRQGRYWGAAGHYLLGLVALESGETEAASAHLARAGGRRYESGHMSVHHALLGRAYLAWSQSDAADLAEAVEEAREHALEAASSVALTDVYWFERAFVPDAPERDLGEPPPADFMRAAVVTPTRCWAMSCLRGGKDTDLEPLLAHVDTSLEKAETFRFERSVVDLGVLRALTLRQMGREEEAVSAMAELLRRPGARVFPRLFEDLGEPVRDLMRRAAEGPEGEARLDQPRAVERETASNDRKPAESPTLRKYPPDSVASPASSSPVRAPRRLGRRGASRLTERELSILELLRERLSNKEIAARLFLTPETVRKYAVTIYRKLNVHGRREAVVVAQAQGLLAGEG